VEHEVPQSHSVTEVMKSVILQTITRRRSSEERSSYLLRDGSLKLRNRIHDWILYFAIG